MCNQETALSVQGLSKAFITVRGTINAVRNISFEIKQSEFVCIVGPSGCGKTTLIYMIAGITKATEGTIRSHDRLLKGISPEIGMVFQKYAAFPWMNVSRNIGYGPRMKRLPKEKIQEITEHYINLVGLKGYEHLYPKELSGGMSKRVDIARAYANDPSILIMDEPFGALDDITKKNMQNELLKIWERESKTVLFVTHDLDEAIYLADRIIVMNPATGGESSMNQIVEVNLERPRKPKIRSSEEFIAIRKYLIEVLDS